MNFIFADSTSVIIFSAFSALMLGLILFALIRAQVSRKKIVGFLIVLGVFSLLVISGFVREHVIPLMPLMFLLILGLTIYSALTELGAKVSQTFSFAVLIGFQAFRLPLELILHRWAELGTIPSTMTWTGQNFDIISGVVCLLAIPFVNRWRWAALVAQMIGSLLLLNVLRVVIMSSPFPFSWPLENPLQLVLYFPYALIGPLFVAPALFGHIVVWRKLKK